MKKIYKFLPLLAVLLFFFQNTTGQNSSPVLSGRFDLGSPSLRWRTLYVENIDASGNVKIGNNLVVSGLATFNNVQFNSRISFTGLGAGFLSTDASGILRAGPL